MNVSGSAVARVPLRTGRHCAGGTAPPQFQQLDCRTSNTGAEAPSSVCQRRAESPSPGGDPGGALASIAARGRHTVAHCWSQRADKLPVATSSREACGPQAAPVAAAVPPSKHEQPRECGCPAAQQVTRANQLANRCACSSRRFLKYEQQQRLKIQTIRFAVDARTIAPKEKFDKRKPPLRARLPPVVMTPAEALRAQPSSF